MTVQQNYKALFIHLSIYYIFINKSINSVLTAVVPKLYGKITNLYSLVQQRDLEWRYVFLKKKRYIYGNSAK